MAQNFGLGNVKLSYKVGYYLKRKLAGNRNLREDFLQYFDVDERTLRRWQSGELNKLDLIDEISDYFGDSIWDVFSDDEDIPNFLNKKSFRKGIKPCRKLFF